MHAIVFLVWILLLSAPSSFAASLGDDFDDDRQDAAKWSTVIETGKGVLEETNHRLEYSVSNPTGDDYVLQAWVAGTGPYDAPWEVQLDLFNDTHPAGADQVDSAGFSLIKCDDENDEVYVELYASQLGGPPERKGFHSELIADDAYVADADVALVQADPLAGAVRIAFDPVGKVLTTSYATTAHDWVPLGSFGVAGANGGTANADWGMTDADQFCVGVYGYSAHMVVTGDHLWMDDFLATGFVGPPAVHDLAVVKLKAPKTITLHGTAAATKSVKVGIQNRSPQPEAVTDLTGLVTLEAASLGASCANAAVALHPGPPNKAKTIKPKKKLTLTFDVTFDCANDPLKGAGHEDFAYTVAVHHEAIDGTPDTHTACDVCPRPPLPGGRDPNPDGKVKDKGCGAKDKATGQRGAAVLSDVVVK